MPRLVCARPRAITRPLSPSLRHSSSSAHPSPAHGSTSSESYPPESFTTPFWRNTLLLLLVGTLSYRFSPPNLFSSDKEGEASYLTRYIAYQLPKAGLWKERNEKHLELCRVAANDQLLVQSAVKPKVARLRFLGTFDQASPNGIVVGSQADLSGLRIKSEKEDFAKLAGDEAEE